MAHSITKSLRFFFVVLQFHRMLVHGTMDTVVACAPLLFVWSLLVRLPLDANLLNNYVPFVENFQNLSTIYTENRKKTNNFRTINYAQLILLQ